MPSHKLSKNSEAAQPPKFYQTLIDKPDDNSIEARIVHEKDLKTDDIQWLLEPGDVDSLRSVGISPAYSKSGGLPVLACAYDTRVLVIKFHATKAYRDGNVIGNGTPSQPPNPGHRNQLDNEFLCNPLYTFYAFDLSPLALSLRLHHHLHLTDGIDIQSILKAPDRSITKAIREVIADSFEILSSNITNTFERMLYVPNNGKDPKHRNLSDLVQRAWLCAYIGQQDSGAIKDKVPKVDMKRFSDNELNVLQKMADDMLRRDNLKPLSVTHKTEARWDPRKGRMVSESPRYAARAPNTSRVTVTLAHNSSASYSLPGGAPKVYGKSTHIPVEHNLEGKSVTSITFFGKQAPTRAESDCGLAILSMLQGTLPLFDSPWMKAIWLSSQPADWPELFSPHPDSPTIEIQEHPSAPINNSQRTALTNMLSSSLETRLALIQGPPGTGKTTVIGTYVLSAIGAGQRGIWLMAQSNVAVKNIAEKLAKLGFFKFKLLVSKGFHFEWHEHLYKMIEANVIILDMLYKPGALRKDLEDSQVILCTLSTMSHPKLSGLTEIVPIINAIIDEASQIEVGQYVPLVKSSGSTLRKLCFIGDDKQLPPHGQDSLHNLQSIFELAHLKESQTFLDTQYRMPPQIGDFISQHVYGGQLKSNPGHVVPPSAVACRFVDVDGCEQLADDGNSSFNEKEVEAIVLLARYLQDEGKSYRIITPYDAQRSELERALQAEGLNWHDKCFNVDSFQGHEDHVIIISVVRSKELGFLTNMRRTNVMLTRCQHGMYIVSSKAFLEGKGANSLIGKMAAELGGRPDAWLTHKDFEEGRFE